MAIQKKYLKTKDLCKVTFNVPPELGKKFEEACLVGDFNNWDIHATPMKKLKKDKSFTVTMSLLKGKEYEFRYLLDGETWINDKEADKHVPTYYPDAENSVISV